MIRFLQFMILTGAFLSVSTFAAPAHIVILRHGEKVDDNQEDLSPQGYARAQALAGYFSGQDFLSKYGVPAAFFAANPNENHSRRSVETIQPSAQKLNVPLVATYGHNHGEELMESILTNPAYDNQTVVICWNHQGMTDLLQPLDQGDTDFPNKWSHKHFDRFWILDHNADGTWDFEQVSQNLLPGDEDTNTSKSSNDDSWWPDFSWF